MQQSRRTGETIDWGAVDLLADDEDDDTTLILRDWAYAGSGWGNTADEELALAAAARAREYAKWKAENNPPTRKEITMSDLPAPERLLTIADLAQMLGVPIQTIYAWRYRDEGPCGYKLGRHVRFRPSAVDEWLESHADVLRVA